MCSGVDPELLSPSSSSAVQTLLGSMPQLLSQSRIRYKPRSDAEFCARGEGKYRLTKEAKAFLEDDGLLDSESVVYERPLSPPLFVRSRMVGTRVSASSADVERSEREKSERSKLSQLVKAVDLARDGSSIGKTKLSDVGDPIDLAQEHMSIIDGWCMRSPI